MLGYHKKILRVDLTERKIEVQDLDDSLLENYIGGAGLGARILYDETTSDTEPLEAGNVLAVMTGPFTDSGVPSSGRHHLMARSPLTGIFGESNVGGTWAVHFKRTGYDGIVVKGKADRPVYLWIHEGGVEIRDAQPVMGRDSIESAEWLKGQTTDKASAAVIGPAGERLARIAGIPHVGNIIRQAARCGLGAVMGSKNLKAMVAFGNRKVAKANETGLREQIKAIIPHIQKVTEAFGKSGTCGSSENYEKLGSFPLKNWQSSRWPDVAKISGTVLNETMLKKRTACFQCPIACGRHIRIENGPYALEGEGPEYETIGTMGGECLVHDLAAICKANDLCNRFGLDTMSTGSVIAFAMEAFEKGLITTADTDGIELRWGSGEALVEMTRKIGLRQGIGELMGEGVLRMAKALGRNAIEFAVHVKGLEPSAHDPRRFWTQAVNYGTAARGACHNASWSHAYEMALFMPEIGIDKPHPSYQLEGKADMTARFQNYQTMNDTLIICRFSQVGKAVTATNIVDWYNLITGRNVDIGELMTVGERIFNLKRLFNTRLGISRKDDFLPPRFLTHNRKGEGITTQLPPMGRLLADYYEVRGWNEEGIPMPEKLRTLGLEVSQGITV